MTSKVLFFDPIYLSLKHLSDRVKKTGLPWKIETKEQDGVPCLTNAWFAV